MFGHLLPGESAIGVGGTRGRPINNPFVQESGRSAGNNCLLPRLQNHPLVFQLFEILRAQCTAPFPCGGSQGGSGSCSLPLPRGFPSLKPSGELNTASYDPQKSEKQLYPLTGATLGEQRKARRGRGSRDFCTHAGAANNPRDPRAAPSPRRSGPSISCVRREGCGAGTKHTAISGWYLPFPTGKGRRTQLGAPRALCRTHWATCWGSEAAEPFAAAKERSKVNWEML